MIVLESKNGSKGTLHQKRVRQRRKSLTDRGRSDVYRESRTTLSSLPETLQTTALPSSPLLTRGYNGYLLAYLDDLLHEAYSAHVYS